MTPTERLSAALRFIVPGGRDASFEWMDDEAVTLFINDPTLEQDIADGQALRLLREACDRAEPFRAWFHVEYAWAMDQHWTVRVERHLKDVQWDFIADTIAEAADACRAALEGRS
jgi:hypothetical protein